MHLRENLKENKIISLLIELSSSQVFWILSFSVLTALAAEITIPVRPVPFTLQTMIVVLSGAFLGAKKGFYSQIIYLSLGVLGLPVFAQIPDATFGFARLFGPTGGYLLAFPLAAFLTGYLVQNRKTYFRVMLAMLAGNTLILILGSLYLGVFYMKNLLLGFEAGLIPFFLWEIVKVFIGSNIYFGISRKYSDESKK